jgi:DNA invertase Pin-like site-specific DNA recombinase
MRVAIYSVDSVSMDVIEQHDLLSKYAEQQGFRVIKSFSEINPHHKTAGSLIGLNSLLKSAKDGEFQHVLVADFSLFGVSINHMLGLVKTLRMRGVGITFLKQDLSTIGDQGEMLLKVMEAMWNYENQQVSDRIKLGQRTALKNGRKLGRPSVRNIAVDSTIKALRRSGMSIKKISEIACVGIGTVYKILDEKVDGLDHAAGIIAH